jgi:hypothetical protein
MDDDERPIAYVNFGNGLEPIYRADVELARSFVTGAGFVKADELKRISLVLLAESVNLGGQNGHGPEHN